VVVQLSSERLQFVNGLGVCSVTEFLVQRSLRGFGTQTSTPFETIDKEWLAWEALANCLVTEH